MRELPDNNKLQDSLDKIAYTLDKAYLSHLQNDYGVSKFEDFYNKDGVVSYEGNIRALSVERWVNDKDESVGDRFKNILSLFSGGDTTIALVVRRTPIDAKMYFVLKNEGIGRFESIQDKIELLADAIQGNFNGTKAPILPPPIEIESLFGESNKSVACLCNIPSEKSEDFVSQGLDKLLNGIVPRNDSESYTVVILAEPLLPETVRQTLNGYETFASEISPHVEYQHQISRNETSSEGGNESTSHTKSISDAVTKTHSFNVGASLTKIVAGVAGFAVAGPVGAAVAAAVVPSVNTGYGYSRGKTHTEGVTDGTTKGTNWSLAKGHTEGDTYTYKSFTLAGLVSKLEEQIKRTQNGQTTGLWKCASYVLAKSAKTSINAANFLRSLTQGDQSFVEPSFINEWSYKNKESTPFDEILQYLKHFTHPIFVNMKDRTPVTASSNVSTTELSNLFAFPRHSVQGLPVVECARFGREPYSLAEIKNDVKMGCAYHMYREELGRHILLNREELTKHTFITGSTGSGKSNAIYRLIESLCYDNPQRKINFLVIEPAKGEYKDAFGGRDEVYVYGTNPYKSPNLLHVNPFSFPDDIHVLEHIDRMVEVFNACWPMYAAMPAILREAVEKSYEYVGWNLRTSKNPGEFPSFNTLMRILPDVIDESAYSADTSSDYKGALITRVRSLTKGIQGLIFSEDTTPKDLFKRNVIVDLSRVGSVETKSLIMGILILKLQEFRMSEGINKSPLRHITVLEEAHHLLRRTSGEQSQESSNLQGKSVEMLANSIAEMRTYGEGFIIADQSPGLMDMAVIRNTNTKIILRLPDEADRVLVGKAAGLNESQITELTKLETGVAAISQSGWLEPVLCKIDEFKGYESLKSDSYDWVDDETAAVKKFIQVAFDVEQLNLNKDEVDKIRKWRDGANISEKAKKAVEAVLENNSLDDTQKMILLINLVGRKLYDATDRDTGMSYVDKALTGRYGFLPEEESVRRIMEFFLLHFPLSNHVNELLTQVEFVDRGAK